MSPGGHGVQLLSETRVARSGVDKQSTESCERTSNAKRRTVYIGFSYARFVFTQRQTHIVIGAHSSYTPVSNKSVLPAIPTRYYVETVNRDGIKQNGVDLHNDNLCEKLNQPNLKYS